MKNHVWKATELKKEDLPAKAQKFIDLMNIDITGLSILLLEVDENGGYFKHIEDSPQGNSPRGVCNNIDNTIYIIKRVKVGVLLHELTHYFLNINLYDTKVIGEAFVKEYGIKALTDYAIVNMFEAEGKLPLIRDVAVCGEKPNIPPPDSRSKYRGWDEVVCEIVATYGRRGQFDKIKALFDNAPHRQKTIYDDTYEEIRSIVKNRVNQQR